MTETVVVAPAPPRSRARIAGVFYLGFFLAAFLDVYVVHRGLAIVGAAFSLVAIGLYFVVTLLLYHLFRPVNRRLSLLAAVCSLSGCFLAVMGRSRPNPLLFFGCYCFLIGYLVYRSTFLPHFPGWLLMLAGTGWLLFQMPIVARHLAAPIEALGILAEAVLMVWLLAKGVDEERWAQLAAQK